MTFFEFMPLFDIFLIYLLFDVFKSKIANAVCHLIKSRTLLSAMEGFQVYDLSILISVPVCIDSIYADLVGLVVWYLKRWHGFSPQPELVLSTVNPFQLMI